MDDIDDDTSDTPATDIIPLNGTPQQKDERGKFLPGNTLGGNRNDGKKRLLYSTLLSAVSTDDLTAMIENIIRIAKQKKSYQASIRAFSLVADILGFKQATLHFESNESQNPSELREILNSRIQELLLEQSEKDRRQVVVLGQFETMSGG